MQCGSRHVRDEIGLVHERRRAETVVRLCRRRQSTKRNERCECSEKTLFHASPFSPTRGLWGVLRRPNAAGFPLLVARGHRVDVDVVDLIGAAAGREAQLHARYADESLERVQVDDRG